VDLDVAPAEPELVLVLPLLALTVPPQSLLPVRAPQKLLLLQLTLPPEL